MAHLAGTGTRTLIIDNYDSFTYNLFHLVGEVSGVTPEVISNDEPGWTLRDLDGFDNVVISAGPGRPERPADFGVCADVIRAASRPLLGVCLGHQGIASVLGGTVGPAPEPLHGRQSLVFHEGLDILAHVPSPFTVVRYHSLLVTDLPAELERIGWTRDGLLMAVRHRHHPMWGVQFHPDSVCTEHGRQIVRNFAELSLRWSAARGNGGGSRRHGRARAPAKRLSPVGGSRESSEPRFRVSHRRLILDIAAEQVFDACFRHSQPSFWLDSSLPGHDVGRFSFMGDASGPLARMATADVASSRITVRSSSGGAQVVEGSFLDWLDADLREHTVDDPQLPFDFTLGWVGYLGYELKAQCGAARRHDSPHPDASMLFADRAIAFDHQESMVYLLALSARGDSEPAEAWLRETAGILERLAADSTRPAPPPGSAPEPGEGVGVGPLELRVERDRYLELVADAQRSIVAGETYEVCLTNMVTADAALDPWTTYRQLRSFNPAPFGAFLRLGSLAVLGCSPERFLRVNRDRTVESRPIKGTRPRSAYPPADARLARELAESAKDRAENLMIVDLVRHDLGACAELGSVQVPTLFAVETYPSVHQLVSTIRARLRADRTAVDCVRSSFPGGSMTGAPKLRTMAIIDELETGPRGVYSGALGYFSLSGTADLSIVIRTLVVEPERVSFGVGGAVIALSDPAAEFEETAVKATPFLRLLGRPFSGLRPDLRSPGDTNASSLPRRE